MTRKSDQPFGSELTPPRRAFLRALANTGAKEPQPANEVARLATATCQEKFLEQSLPKLVLHALEHAGYIETTRTTAGEPLLVAPTEKLATDAVEPLLKRLESQADPEFVTLLRRPLPDVLSAAESTDKHIAGLALEALAFKIIRLLDLDYVSTRLQGAQTGGAEVELIFESSRLVFTRWQIRCKNTARLTLDDVAKEVGLAYVLKSSGVVAATTGTVAPEARRYANSIIGTSNLDVVMLDGADLRTIAASPARIVRIFSREARHAMRLKQPGIRAMEWGELPQARLKTGPGRGYGAAQNSPN